MVLVRGHEEAPGGKDTGFPRMLHVSAAKHSFISKEANNN